MRRCSLKINYSCASVTSFEAPAEDDDDLPDLYRYLDALGTADSELDGPAQPPELFHPEAEHRHNYNNITLLKCEVEEEEVTPYVDEFDKGTQDDVLMVGKISLEEIQVGGHAQLPLGFGLSSLNCTVKTFE